MFDYCTSGLGYSEPAAVRRIRTARCVALFPEVYALLESNETNLSSIARVSRVLTAGNKDALLPRIRGRSQREIDAIVAEYQPHVGRRDVVRSVVVRVPVAALALAAASDGTNVVAGPLTAASHGLDTVAGPVAFVSDDTREAASSVGRASDDACEKDAYRRCDGKLPASPANSNVGFATEKRIQFQFTATGAFREKLEKVKSLAWHRLPANPSLEQAFELALDCFIERHDPRARSERRERRREETHAREAGDARRAGDARPSGGARRAGDARPSRGVRRAAIASRHVATTVRDGVFVRDEGRCAFVGTNGKRCASTSALQVDHIKPVARDGTSTPDNLRLLCAYHNRLEAERVMGPLAHMRE